MTVRLSIAVSVINAEDAADEALDILQLLRISNQNRAQSLYESLAGSLLRHGSSRVRHNSADCVAVSSVNKEAVESVDMKLWVSF